VFFLGAPQKYRQRYIVFEVQGEPGKGELINYLSQLSKDRELMPKVWLILYRESEGTGILKCTHLQLSKLKKEMENSKRFQFEILGVSGTIKKARQKFL
jgi:RNase P/RNase MRP subunit POP5